MQKTEETMAMWMRMNREEVIARFAGLAGAVVRGTGERQFVYVPGARDNRVLLVAHADTVWDDYNESCTPVLEHGVFLSGLPERGIGADDRAGCAILWELRDSGHSLLVTSGEECGQKASNWIMNDRVNRDIAEEINERHQFVVQFDRRNAADFKCYDVGSEQFREYCGKMTEYIDAGKSSTTDIRVLCRDICGVNLSVGYHYEHTPAETLNMQEWQHTLSVARKWLSGDKLPRFVRE